MEHIKRVGRELMYKGSMLEFYKDTIVTPDGKTVYWDHIEHKGHRHGAAQRGGRPVVLRSHQAIGRSFRAVAGLHHQGF